MASAWSPGLYKVLSPLSSLHLRIKVKCTGCFHRLVVSPAPQGAPLFPHGGRPLGTATREGAGAGAGACKTFFEDRFFIQPCFLIVEQALGSHRNVAYLRWGGCGGRRVSALNTVLGRRTGCEWPGSLGGTPSVCAVRTGLVLSGQPGHTRARADRWDGRGVEGPARDERDGAGSLG